MIRRPALRGLLPLILLLALWQVFGDPASPYFPPPSRWVTATQRMFEQGVLIPALLSTLWVMLVSVVAVVIVGGALGAVLGRNPRLERLLRPTIEVFRTMPPPTIVPIAILLFGANPASAIALTTFTAMWIVVLNTSAAARQIPPVRVEAARSLGLSRTETLWKVLVPSLVPGVSLGLRVAAPIILIVVLLMEMLTSLSGMGRLLIQAQQSFAVDRMFAVLAIVGTIGFLLNRVVALIQERLVGVWRSGA